MNKDSILVSPKHGLNPSLETCFICGEDKGTLILFGRIQGDEEAPRRTCVNREPCEKCKEWMAQGVICISVDEKRSRNQANPYRTGGWVVLREEAIRRIVSPPELAEEICKKRCTFLPDEVWNALEFPRG